MKGCVKNEGLPFYISLFPVPTLSHLCHCWAFSLFDLVKIEWEYYYFFLLKKKDGLGDDDIKCLVINSHFGNTSQFFYIFLFYGSLINWHTLQCWYYCCFSINELYSIYFIHFMSNEGLHECNSSHILYRILFFSATHNVSYAHIFKTKNSTFF